MIGEEASDLTRVVGIAMAGVPLAAGLSVAGGISGGFTRKMEGVKSVEAFRKVVENYGEHSLIEGEITNGDKVGLVDDLVTRFDSKLVALEQLRYEVERRGLSDVECKTVIVALDREQGGRESAEKAGLQLLSLIPFKTLGLPLLKDFMAPVEWETLSHYLRDPEHFQDRNVQQEVERLSAGK
jgi:orotate phosphoribosyltransferase